jgi:hypothetical protein
VALAAWIGVRTVAASGQTWVPVPLIGYVREDVAVGLLAAGAVVWWILSKLPTLLQVTLVALVLGAPLVAEPPRVYLREPPDAETLRRSKSFGSTSPVQVLPGLSKDDSARIAAAAWEERRVWTKFSMSMFIGYFGFGGSLNFDAADDPSELPAWSLGSGFSSRLAYESAWAWRIEGDEPIMSKERAELLDAIARLPWYTEKLRSVISAALGVPPSNVVFGGEGPLADQSLTHPCVQIMLPSIFWHLVCNPHVDTLYFVPEIDGEPCDKKSLRTFLLPLTNAAGAGLISWTYDKKTRQVVEHTAHYEVGNLYSFNAAVAHAIKPFPYFELWTTPRMTIQAFGTKCGDTWYIYH